LTDAQFGELIKAIDNVGPSWHWVVALTAAAVYAATYLREISQNLRSVAFVLLVREGFMDREACEEALRPPRRWGWTLVIPFLVILGALIIAWLVFELPR